MQGITALNVNKLGMSLTRMNHPDEIARFLDDFDVTLTLDNRAARGQQLTSVDLKMDPIVFRASYRDINLIMAIVNKAIALSSNAGKSGIDDSLEVLSTVQQRPKPGRVSARAIASRMATTEAPQLLVTKEQARPSPARLPADAPNSSRQLLTDSS